jgi:hypothetical protein
MSTNGSDDCSESHSLAFFLGLVFLVVLFIAQCGVPVAKAQPVAPGWTPTGEWQCGPHVRIITSVDGGHGIDFFVVGAWFDNHFTLRRGQLFYNGAPCLAVGQPIGGPMPRRTRVPDRPSDPNCVPDMAGAREPICE